ncbi:nucleoside hydrolase [Consotaella aegiceratis]|uniref:nucleoside hydrolase n=1 Tax=Consotaella aegiceratis TaxID=3097961 RepID=UPI002F3F03F3
MTAAPTRLIIDCDPGHDDMAAILLAAHHPAISVEAITTVCGNASVDNTTNNALRIVTAFGLDVPVFRGAPQPLLHRYDYPSAFHGPTGLDSAGVDLPPSARQEEKKSAVEAIIERVENNPGAISIAVLGPMTNLGLVLAQRPDLAGAIKQIVFMGGSTGEGNVTAVAEFNIWADAEAARIVLRSGVRLAMFGLNVTHQALICPADLDAVRAAVPGENAVADILDFYCRTFYRFAGADQPGAPIHDPCPIAYLIAPEIFETVACPGKVVVGNESYGQTLIDMRRQDPTHDSRTRNVTVATAIDQKRFTALLIPALCWGAEQLRNGLSAAT